MIIACVGGGSNAIGIFDPFVNDSSVRLIGTEAGGRSATLGQHAARFNGGSPGVLHGAFSYLLQDEDGQVCTTHSVSAGLDYALVGPEHAWLHDQHRAEYVLLAMPTRWRQPRYWPVRKVSSRLSNPLTPLPKQSAEHRLSPTRLIS